MKWNFWQRAQAFLRPGVQVLFIGAEGMEELLALGHPIPLLRLALPGHQCFREKKQLVPLGAEVCPWEPGDPLPFDDGSMDLALCFRLPCCLEEIRRVLCPGGFFLTEQLGAEDHRAVGLSPDYNLENCLPLFRQAGFRIVYANQEYSHTGCGQALQHRFIITAGLRAGKREGCG